MKEKNVLALIVAYYLSKYDKKAVKNLGYRSFKEAFEEIGKQLRVNKNTIKNMRDEFDPLHENSRVGWYQRELRPSRKEVAEKYHTLQEEDLREIIIEIIRNDKFINSKECKNVINSISTDDNEKNRNNYIVRGPTGKKAEKIFIDYYYKTGNPIKGILEDTRELGCGYDFKIKTGDSNYYYIEVKGLAPIDGGVLFTNKEWMIAKREKEKYYLVFVNSVDNEPNINIIKNPANILKPNKRIYTVMRIDWNVSPSQMSEVLES